MKIKQYRFTTKLLNMFDKKQNIKIVNNNNRYRARKIIISLYNIILLLKMFDKKQNINI